MLGVFTDHRNLLRYWAGFLFVFCFLFCFVSCFCFICQRWNWWLPLAVGGKVRISVRISLDFFRAQALPSTEDKCGDRGVFLVMTQTVSAKQGSRGRTLELPEPALAGGTSLERETPSGQVAPVCRRSWTGGLPFTLSSLWFACAAGVRKAASLSEQAQDRHRGGLLPSLALTRILSKSSSLASIFSSTKRD